MAGSREDSDNSIDIVKLVVEESQKDQSSDRNAKKKTKEEEKRAEAYAKKYNELLKKYNGDHFKAEMEFQKGLEELAAHEEEKKNKDRRNKLKEQIEYASNLEEKLAAERQLKLAEGQKALTEAMVSAVNDALNGTFENIRQAGKDYAEYVERLEVGLIGSTKSYDSVSDKLSKVFALNVFFSMEDALKKTTEMVESGINYNVELRASLATMSDKIVKTFDALDANLLRIVRIQQSDSTQARLGMESLLQEYLNSNFQNSEYLHGVSDQVTGYLLEAEAMMGRNQAVEFEYAVQKWLGSFSSLGVSEQTIMALAQGLGYLGSGDVDALAGNESLQQLLAISIQKGGGTKSYGDMLTQGIGVKDVSTILSGFYKLVKQVSDSGNLAAMNQYADLFGLTMSDITSVLNLTDQSIGQIASNMASYQSTINRVTEEMSVSKLYKRTSASEMFNNMQKNMLTSIGLDMADSLAMNLMYEALDQAANIVDMFDMGVEVDPFGVGASVKLEAGALVRGAAAGATYLTAYLKNIAGLSSMLTPNLKLLGGEESVKVMGGSGLNQVSTGKSSNQQTYVGRTDNSGVYDTVNQETQKSSSEIMQVDVDEEKENMKKTQKAMEDIGDNVKFIVQLLNENGIKVRSMPGAIDNSIVIPTASNGFASLIGGK